MKNLDAQRLSKLSQWRERILARSKSAHSIRQWCKENGFTDQQYYYWHRQVRDAQLVHPPNHHVSLSKSKRPDHVIRNHVKIWIST